TLTGMTPVDGVDLATPSAGGAPWPLASACVDEGVGAERLVFSADVAGHALRAALWRGGEVVASWRLPDCVWLRQSPVLLSVARRGAGQDLEISAAVCGMPVREME